ncbi:MAG: DUF3021 domain-containing protein [Lachnospiraceae bacterium]|nr:DUF3021 domain-containing protein [Lachnospiraceae bacterium]
MKYRDRFLINSLIGLVLGMIVGIVIWVIPPVNSEGRSLLLHVIMSGLHGLIPCGAATVYEIEEWGVTKSTVVHASVTLATILAIEIPMGWWQTGGQIALALVIYTIMYTIIWLINYLYWKKMVRELNRQLNIIHGAGGEDSKITG